jgi:hypothetical protein
MPYSMSPVLALRKHARALLGLRQKRALPRKGGKPRIGSRIFFEDARMTVPAGFTDEIWAWLAERGWREAIYRPERRNYREVPTAWATRLVDCDPDQRSSVLAAALTKAVSRPAADNPDTLAVYIKRK